MAIGMVVALIFSLIFVLYINSFLMKQRKKELGLYNILGMGKGHIAVVLFFETVYVGLAGIGRGPAGRYTAAQAGDAVAVPDAQFQRPLRLLHILDGYGADGGGLCRAAGADAAGEPGQGPGLQAH